MVNGIILNTQNATSQDQQESTVNRGKAVLVAKNVTKRFGPHLVLDNVSLSIETGKTTVVIGPSGCGKTVLIKHLIALLKMDVATSEKIADKWKAAFDEQVKVTHAQQKYYESEIKALKKWYRSPVLWFSVGVIVTGALAVGLNYGLAETRN